MLHDLPPPHREDCVNSLAYEADARVQDPVYGCVGAISILQQQVFPHPSSTYLTTHFFLIHKLQTFKIPSSECTVLTYDLIFIVRLLAFARIYSSPGSICKTPEESVASSVPFVWKDPVKLADG